MLSNEEDPQARVLHELHSMIISTLRFPSPITLPFPATFSPEYPSSSSSSSIRRNRSPYSSARISPASFACMFLGISVTLMIFGSVTFLIGLILMPWITGLVLIVYFAGIISNLSDVARSLLNWALFPRHVPACKHL